VPREVTSGALRPGLLQARNGGVVSRGRGIVSSGTTLTAVLDVRIGSVVGLASNAKQLTVQHGSLEAVGA
jgi:hypothetical protein